MLKRLSIMITLFTTFLVSVIFSPVQAAPIWVERNLIAKNELIDAVFTKRDEASQIVIDHSPWNKFLATYVSARDDGLNVVDYKAVSPSDLAALNAYIETSSKVDVTTLNADEQLAYWINIYNALTVQLILTSPSVSSIRDIKKPWSHVRTNVNGVDLTLNDIESGIIRPVFNDPRIHYAVNCASIGCPNLALTAYTSVGLNERLDSAAYEYINHPRGVRLKGRKVIVSKIYGWYKEDFGDNQSAVLDHILKHASDELKASLSGKTSISKYKYDWDINDIDAAPAK